MRSCLVILILAVSAPAAMAGPEHKLGPSNLTQKSVGKMSSAPSSGASVQTSIAAVSGN